MGVGKYIIEDGVIRKVEDLMEWAVWMETHERGIVLSKIETVTVSTVFLGLDHDHWGKGAPILFETMIFGEVVPKLDGCMWRYATEAQARRGHEIICDKVREFFPDGELDEQEFKTGVKVRFDM